MIKNIILHFHLVNKHRFTVLKLCIKAGIPFRGLLHDLSKYSPIKFFESAKYYNGKGSPISVCKTKNGYSKAWLHHKGRNKHHQEYYLKDKKNKKINDKIDKVLIEVYERVAKEGIKKVIKPKILKEIYNKHVNG